MLGEKKNLDQHPFVMFDSSDKQQGVLQSLPVTSSSHGILASPPDSPPRSFTGILLALDQPRRPFFSACPQTQSFFSVDLRPPRIQPQLRARERTVSLRPENSLEVEGETGIVLLDEHTRGALDSLRPDSTLLSERR